MTDKEALSSIISCNTRICMNAMDNDPDDLPICACTFCKYKENRKNGEDCWAMNIADYILEVIPQLDTTKELAEKIVKNVYVIASHEGKISRHIVSGKGKAYVEKAKAETEKRIQNKFTKEKVEVIELEVEE